MDGPQAAPSSSLEIWAWQKRSPPGQISDGFKIAVVVWRPLLAENNDSPWEMGRSKGGRTTDVVTGEKAGAGAVGRRFF